MLPSIHTKVREGRRISREEGLWLLCNAELLDLAELANEARFLRNPEPRVTFVIDTNPNYSNICTNLCKFCAFGKEKGKQYPTDEQLDEELKQILLKNAQKEFKQNIGPSDAADEGLTPK